MSFTTPSGSRGARQPRGPVLRFVNKLAVGRVRRKGGTTMGMNVLVLRTVGRTSGEPRETPVAWFPGPDGSWVVVASAAGAPSHPSWYRNLAAHPDQVSIEVDGRTVDVTAEELHGAERDEAWAQVVAALPRFAGYQEHTDRVLPVIRLVPRA
ncbi:MAG TPA: nitroreductase/quinone reductase family protein [Cellulomonas sp.]